MKENQLRSTTSSSAPIGMLRRPTPPQETEDGQEAWSKITSLYEGRLRPQLNDLMENLGSRAQHGKNSIRYDF